MNHFFIEVSLQASGYTPGVTCASEVGATTASVDSGPVQIYNGGDT